MCLLVKRIQLAGSFSWGLVLRLLKYTILMRIKPVVFYSHSIFIRNYSQKYILYLSKPFYWALAQSSQMLKSSICSVIFI